MNKSFYILAIFILQYSNSISQTLDLIYKPIVGSKYYIEIESNSDSYMKFKLDGLSEEEKKELADTKILMKMDMLYRYKTTVVGVNANGDISLNMSIDFWRFGGGVDENQVELNSAQKIEDIDEDNRERFSRIKSIVGIEFSILISKYGKVLSVKDYSKVVQAMYGDDINKPNFLGNIPSLNEDDFKQSMSDLFYIFPENKKATEGMFWTIKSSVNTMNGPMNTTTKYILVKDLESSSVINATTTLLSSVKGITDFKLSGTNKIYFNKGDGIALENEGSGTMNGVIDYNALKMNMDATFTSKMRIYKADF